MDPNFTSAPNVGPEPPGLMAAIGQKLFGQPAAPGTGAPADPYEAITPQVALQILTETRQMCDPGREQFEWLWWRILMYFRGRMWIWWDPSSRLWKDKRLAKWIPKPVTNLIRSAALSIRATLSSIQLGISASPVGQDPKNILAADTASDLVAPLYKEHKMATQVMPEADLWAILLGNAYLHPHWDPDDWTHTKTQDMWLCAMCGVQSSSEAITGNGQRCPDCNADGAQFTQGQPSTEPVGRGRTIAVSPLELLLPLYAQSFEACDRLIYLTWRPKHEIENSYPPDVVAKVQWDQGPQQRSLQLYRQLGALSDLVTGPTAGPGGAGFSGQISGTTEQHLWMKPSKKYPEGLHIVFLGEGTPIPVLTDDKQQPLRPSIPYLTKKGQPIWPWIHYPYEPTPGGLYAEGAVYSSLSKNDSVNKIDSMTELTATRMGNPIWLEPKGAEVERFTGEPGLIVRYQSVGPSGSKPERISGENPPASFFTLRDQHKQDIEEDTGTYDVLKGGKPPGVDSFSGLQLLVDRSQSRFTGVFSARSHVQEQWFAVALELERSYGPAERTLSVLGPNNTWTFQTFQQMDLDGDVNIIVDDGTKTPKTALGRRAAIEHGSQMGIVAPTNPEERFKLLQELGLTSLIPSLEADVSSCLEEQDAFEKWVTAGGPQSGQPSPLIRMPWHNDAVHLGENRKWMNSDTISTFLKDKKYAALVPVLIKLLADHLLEHQMGLQAQTMLSSGPDGTQADPASPNGAPAPGGPSKPGAPPLGGSGSGAPPKGSAASGSDGGGRGAGRAMRNSNQNSKPQQQGGQAARGAI